MNKISIYLNLCNSQKCCIKLFDSNLLQVDEVIFETQKNLIDIINPIVFELLEKNNYIFDDLQKIFIVDGPGNFTGIRVAVSIAKTWKIVYNNLEIYRLNSLELMSNGSDICIMKQNNSNYYCAIYQNNNIVFSPNIIHNDELEKLILKYNNLPIIKEEEYDYSSLVNLIKFKLVDDIFLWEPFYIKGPI